MHLSDNDLLVLDASQNEHLQQCSACQQRLGNLQQIRENLQNSVDVQVPDKAHKVAQFKQLLLESSHDSPVQQVQQVQSHHWRNPKVILGGLALAASLFLAVQWLPTMLKQSQPMDSSQQLEQLIAQHQVLLDSYYAQKSQSARQVKSADAIGLKKLDEEIQRAYLDNLDNQQLSLLWQRKIDNLNKELNNEDHLIRI